MYDALEVQPPSRLIIVGADKRRGMITLAIEYSIDHFHAFNIEQHVDAADSACVHEQMLTDSIRRWAFTDDGKQEFSQITMI